MLAFLQCVYAKNTPAIDSVPREGRDLSPHTKAGLYKPLDWTVRDTSAADSDPLSIECLYIPDCAQFLRPAYYAGLTSL